MSRRYVWDHTDPREQMIFGLVGPCGSTAGVNDESARIVDGFAVTEYEMLMLARCYTDLYWENEFMFACMEHADASAERFQAFASRRMVAIEGLLGKERVQAAMAETEAKWSVKFENLKKKKGEPVPCENCGKGMSWSDAMGTARSLCSECRDIPW